MRKFLFLVLISFTLLGCNNQTAEKQSSSAITITINSDDGQTVMTVDEGTRNITSATYTSAETGLTVNKLYSYNKEELRSVAVSDPVKGSYTLSYEEDTGTTRSLIAEETNVPRKVMKIHKTYNGTTRAAASYESSSPDIVEYQYDENGNLTSIFRIDDKNNIICKGEF